MNEVGKTFNVDRCFIRLFNSQTDEYLPIKAEYLSSSDVKSLKGSVYSNQTNEYFKVHHKSNKIVAIDKFEDVQNETEQRKKFLKDFFVEYNIKSAYGFPIFSEAKLSAVLVLQSTNSHQPITDDEINIKNNINSNRNCSKASRIVQYS